MAIKLEKNENSSNGGYLVDFEDMQVPVGKPRTSEKGNKVYQGGSWITQTIGNQKKEHLLRVNVMITDCGVKKKNK